DEWGDLLSQSHCLFWCRQIERHNNGVTHGHISLADPEDCRCYGRCREIWAKDSPPAPDPPGAHKSHFPQDERSCKASRKVPPRVTSFLRRRCRRSISSTGFC